MGRTSLAIAPSNPDVMYALAASNVPGPQGIYEQGLLAVYRSDRGGAAGTWETRVNHHDADLPQHHAADQHRDRGGARLQSAGRQRDAGGDGVVQQRDRGRPSRSESRVGGRRRLVAAPTMADRNWGLASLGLWPNFARRTAHADQHAITFHPNYDGDSNQIALIGNDGGIFRTTNARAATSTAICAGGQPIQVAWTSLNRGYGVTQFYHGTPFPDGTQYLAGAQDNNTLLGSDAAGPDGWKPVFGGDGGFSAVHPTQTSTWLMEYQWANLGRTTNAGLNISTARTGLDPIFASNIGPESNYLFIAPFTHDPVNQLIWLGGNYLYRGATVRADVEKVAELTRCPTAAASARLRCRHQHRHGVRDWHGSGSHHSRDRRTARSRGLITFNIHAAPGMGHIDRRSIRIDDNVLYATYGNFGGAHVFRSIDNGETWQSLDGSGPTGLPDIPVHSIVVDPDDRQRLYLGTDLGVMVSIDGGRTWMSEETGFGPAVTMWLSLIRTPAGQKQLFAFTHGRGAWRVTLR